MKVMTGSAVGVGIAQGWALMDKREVFASNKQMCAVHTHVLRPIGSNSGAHIQIDRGS